MRRFNNTWPGSDNDDYFKLVAEQIAELVDSYSWSSYRAKATSTTFKAAELNSLAAQVKNGEISKPTISHAVEEYIDTLSEDRAVRKICDAKGLSLGSLTPRSDASVERLMVLTTMMLEIISPSYIETCIDEVIKGCTTKKSKNTIRFYLKLLVPALINSGVPRQWIYERVIASFYSPDIDECSVDFIRDFFASLTDDKGEFCFLFRTNVDFGNYLKGLEDAIELYSKAEDVPQEFSDSLSALPKTQGKNVYVHIPYRRDSDPHSAARTFNRWISLLRSLLYLADIGQKGLTPRSALCLKKGHDQAFKVHLDDFFHPGRERPLEQSGAAKISKNLHLYAGKVSRSRNENSPQRFFSSLSAVSLASKSYQPDSRLLAIWAGFEGLLPAPIDQSIPRIVHFERLITPCVTSDYIPRVFSEFRHDCLSLNREGVTDVLKKNLESVDSLRDFVEIFYADKCIKADFCLAISASPLLLNRALELDLLANSAAKIQTLRSAHIRRVRWQVNRIYRERNAIVHKASRTTVVQNLSEHAYNYFRSVILSLEASFNKFGISDTDASLELIRQLDNELTDEVATKNRDIGGFDSASDHAKSMLDLVFSRRLREA